MAPLIEKKLCFLQSFNITSFYDKKSQQSHSPPSPAPQISVERPTTNLQRYFYYRMKRMDESSLLQTT